MAGTPPRPKKQDIKPKAFKLPATQEILYKPTPSERRLLWIIAHYPYIFNMHFLDDMLKISRDQAKEDSALGRALKVYSSLLDKGYIRQTKDLLKLKITWTGYSYRVKSHAAFDIAAPLIGFFGLAITIVLIVLPAIGRGCKAEKTKSSTLKPGDSAEYNQPQTVPLKAKDSFSVQSDTTKTPKREDSAKK